MYVSLQECLSVCLHVCMCVCALVCVSVCLLLGCASAALPHYSSLLPLGQPYKSTACSLSSMLSSCAISPEDDRMASGTERFCTADESRRQLASWWSYTLSLVLLSRDFSLTEAATECVFWKWALASGDTQVPLSEQCCANTGVQWTYLGVQAPSRYASFGRKVYSPKFKGSSCATFLLWDGNNNNENNG
jgi:hypothetical protein